MRPSNAVRHLIEAWDAQALAEIDPEEFTDFATVRPHVRLTDGRTRSIVWPTVGAWSASTPGGDVILMLGPEPALRWRLFSEQVVGIAQHHGAGMLLTLGALLADVPHSRAGAADRHGHRPRAHHAASTCSAAATRVPPASSACCTTHAPAADLASASLWAAVPGIRLAGAVAEGVAGAGHAHLRAARHARPRSAGWRRRRCEYEGRVSALVSDDDDLIGYVARLETMSSTRTTTTRTMTTTRSAASWPTSSSRSTSKR